MPKKYRLYDTYEGLERLGEFDTMREVRRAAAKRDAETDGECYLIVSRFEKSSGAYRVLQGWTY